MGLGSEIRKKTHSGSRIRVQGSKMHRIRIRNTADIRILAFVLLFMILTLALKPFWIRIHDVFVTKLR